MRSVPKPEQAGSSSTLSIAQKTRYLKLLATPFVSALVDVLIRSRFLPSARSPFRHDVVYQ
ncbi:MAG: hypothetical protein R3C26_02475 [Calditrichia bacterium]